MGKTNSSLLWRPTSSAVASPCWHQGGGVATSNAAKAATSTIPTVFVREFINFSPGVAAFEVPPPCWPAPTR